MVEMRDAAIAILGELQVRRKFYIGAANRLTNATRALVRRELGFSNALPEAERAKIARRAERLVAALMRDGAPPESEDGPAAHAVMGDVGVAHAALGPLVAARAHIEKSMKAEARLLPVWAAFGKGAHGFGELGLAVLVGECGDLSQYGTVSKLWKRCGLAPFEGKAGSTWRKEGGLSKEQWTALGYAPRRRAEIYAVIGDPLFRAQSVAKGPYRAVYDARRAHTAITHPDWTKAHSHNDALRVMTKSLIADLWSAWRGHFISETQDDHAPPPSAPAGDEA